MVFGLLGFGFVVLLSLSFGRLGQTASSDRRARPAPIAFVPTPGRAALVLVATGLELGGVIPVLLSATSNTAFETSNDVATVNAAVHRQFHATIVYMLVVLLPAFVVLSIASVRRSIVARRADAPRRSWFFRSNPIFGEAFRALGRATALPLIAAGVVPAWIGWAVARHYGA